MKSHVAVMIVFALVGARSLLFGDQCRLTFADQSDWYGKRGFYLGLENDSASDTPCQVSTLRLAVGSADGTYWRAIVFTPPAWKMEHDYTARVLITPSYFELYLDNALLGHVDAAFAGLPEQVMQVDFVPGWASDPTQYIAAQNSLLAQSSGGASVSFDNIAASNRSVPLTLLAPGTMPQKTAFPHHSGDSLTVTTVFRLSSLPDFRQFAPYFDRYGQSIHASFPGKITSDADLLSAGAQEEARLSDWGLPNAYDQYGGVFNSGWGESGTGFYRVTQRDGVWWLISPEGNPCFYIGLDDAPALAWDRTPVTGRNSLFAWIPDKTPPYDKIWGVNSWSQNDGTEDVSYGGVNLIRKYGDAWESRAVDSTVRRMKTWGFSGYGKWDAAGNLPILPVLNRWDVPLLDRHPDIFDAAVRQQFRTILERQIAPHRSDPLVVGWSLGNEYDEIITTQETTNILNLGSGVPAKRALVDEALKDLYDGNLAALARAWGIAASQAQEVYNARPNPPETDVEALRRFYARNYYWWIYNTVKQLDHNHLYFGFWIVPGWWENDSDWDIAAEFVDVIGYDNYSYRLSTDWLNGFITRTGKPVLCGEFSFPPHYNLRRGYRVYGNVSSVDDADAGRLYHQWLMDAARHPYVVGVAWFQYRDEPVSGRGPGQGPELVYGEDYAFGLVDVGDRPKWDLVTQVRDANLSVAQRRLNFRRPVLNAGGAVSSASFLPGAAVAPGSLISIFGVNLAADAAGASSLPLPLGLAGASLKIGGVPVPLVHAAPPYQIDAVVPWELAGQAQAQLEISTDGLKGNSIPVNLTQYAPGIFTVDSSGRGQGTVLIDGTSLLAAPTSATYPGRPAKRGEWLNIYCTGLGSVNNQPASGAPAPSSPLANTVIAAKAKIGGLDAPVNFSGLAAGFAGLYQVNARVPESVSPGDSVTVTLEIGGAVSNTARIAVE